MTLDKKYLYFARSITSRLMSLDVFRGITISLMILVNSPGNDTPYHSLAHSLWNGCTLADLVFPFFVVIVGISSVLALSNLSAQGVSTPQLLKKIIRRSVCIFITGLLLNAFSRHVDLSTFRVMGVLQRIAICYFFSATLYITTRIRTQALIVVVLISGYGFLMTCITPFEQVNLAFYLDTLILSPTHLYYPTFDPEGLFTTIPAVASVLLGNLIGCCILRSQTKKQLFQGMMAAGSMFALLGWIWRFILPLNKALWSSSYVLWTAGLALLVFAVVYALIEIKQWVTWSKPFELLGRHAMLVYVLHVVCLKIQAMIPMQTTDGVVVNFRLYITDLLFNHLTPENAALSYSICYIALWLLVILGLEKWRTL